MTKVKIAFDLDGVLIPDYNQIPNTSDHEFFMQTLYAKPLFNPDYDFDIVTARVEKWRAITETWLRQLKKYPINVFLKETSLEESPAEYKYRISKNQNYKIFIESDFVIVQEMKKLIKNDNLDIDVIHYDSWVSNNIKRR